MNRDRLTGQKVGKWTMLVDQLFTIRDVAPSGCQPAYLITEVLFLAMLQVSALWSPWEWFVALLLRHCLLCLPRSSILFPICKDAMTLFRLSDVVEQSVPSLPPEDADMQPTQARAAE